MGKSSQRMIDKGWKRINKNTAQLSKMFADVGIQSDAGADKKGNPVINRAVANEFGTRFVPERSFIRAAFDEKQNELNQLKTRLVGGVIDGKITPKKAAELLGQQHENDVKNKIRQGPFVALALSTVDRKGSTKPLIDTGQMINSIRYVVGSK